MSSEMIQSPMDTNRESSIIGELFECSDSSGLIGGYCEEGFPLYYVNDTMVRMLGYDSRDEFTRAIGGLVANTIHPEDMPQVMRDLGTDYYEGMTYDTSYRMPKKDGSYFWTTDRGKVIRAADGRLAIISMCSDLTTVVNRYRLMEKENYKINQTLLNIPGGYHRCARTDGYPFLYISDRFLEITGWTRSEIAEKFDNKFMNMVYPDDETLVDDYVEVIDRHNSRNESYLDGIYRICCRDGYRWFSDTSVIVEIGTDVFIQGIISDITPFIQKEQQNKEELKAALKQAEVAAEAKTNFLFNISHEIRTPLNAIQGFNELAVRHVKEPDRALDALGKSAIACRQLLGTINEILDMSRIESGKMSLNIGTIDVREHIESIETIFRQMSEEKGIVFQTIDRTRTPYVSGDGQRISQIVTNLLSNAVKFTPAGGSVTYRIDETVSEDGKSVTFAVSVKDTGVGMSKDFQAKMYNVFEREVDPANVVQGTGLGLSITQRLTEEMHGSLSCESELGKGTEFIFTCTLPVAHVQPKADEDSLSGTSLEGIRLLLVEDNALNREIAAAILEERGCTVETAANGLEAVEKVMEAPADHYGVILMDVQMPIMNGYKAAAVIRALKDEKKAAVPIIAMTANVFAEDRRRALEAGMNAHVGKPIDQNVLIRTILQFV